MLKSCFGQQGCRALTFALAGLSGYIYIYIHLYLYTAVGNLCTVVLKNNKARVTGLNFFSLIVWVYLCLAVVASQKCTAKFREN